MKAYLQGPDGQEIELVVQKTEPDDGTIVLRLPDFSFDVVLRSDGWVRIVSD